MVRCGDIETEIKFLLDSGADHSLMTYEHAQEWLSILEDNRATHGTMTILGIGGPIEVVELDVEVVIGHGEEIWSDVITVRVPTNPLRGFNVSVLGRVPLFRRFDVSFHLDDIDGSRPPYIGLSTPHNEECNA